MPTPLTPTPSLERVLQQLHDSEINSGVQMFYDAGMRVWIGDERTASARRWSYRACIGSSRKWSWK